MIDVVCCKITRAIASELDDAVRDALLPKLVSGEVRVGEL